MGSKLSILKNVPTPNVELAIQQWHPSEICDTGDIQALAEGDRGNDLEDSSMTHLT